jgi:hypothetical protein
MNEIETIKRQLPDSLPDLAKFALIGREKLNAVRAEIRAIEKVGLAKEVHEQKLMEAQEIAEAVLDAEIKIGELTRQIPKASGGDRRSKDFKKDSSVHFETKEETVEQAGFTVKQAQRFETLAKHPEAVEKAKAIARENGDIVSRQSVMRIIAADAPQPPKKTNSAHEAKQRHAEFEEKKADGIVNLSDAKQDKADRKAIANEIYMELLKITTKTHWLATLNNKEGFADMRNNLSKEEAERLAERLEKAMPVLGYVLNLLKGGKN